MQGGSGESAPGLEAGRSFGAEVYFPDDPGRARPGSVRATAAVLTILVGEASLVLDQSRTFLSLAGHNNSRVAIDAAVADEAAPGGLTIYAQVVDPAFLAWLAEHGPASLRGPAASLGRRARAVSRRWRIGAAALAVALTIGVVLLLVSFNALVDRAVARVPVSWEVALGESSFAAATAGLPEAAAGERAVVEAAFARLLPHVAETGYLFSWKVVKEPQVNAFALPGGKIVVFSGLVEAARRPEEVAGVLAHEIEHALLRHSLQRLVRSAGIRGVVGLLLGDLEGMAGAVRDAGVQLRELSYDRDQERAADLAAIELLARAGIDPAGLVDFFDRLSAQEGGGGDPATGKALSLLSTHPESAERSAVLRRRISELGARTYENLQAP